MSPSESERVRSSGRLRSHRTWLRCEGSGRKGEGKERERKGTKGMYVRVRGMKETRKERGGRERDRGIGENRSVPLHHPPFKVAATRREDSCLPRHEFTNPETPDCCEKMSKYDCTEPGAFRLRQRSQDWSSAVGVIRSGRGVVGVIGLVRSKRTASG